MHLPSFREHRTGLPFDDQAADFDRRAGLPAAASRDVAAAVGRIASNTQGWLLDLGAGTGEIGADLARGTRPDIGLDLSLPMLAVFRRSWPPAPGPPQRRASSSAPTATGRGPSPPARWASSSPRAAPTCCASST